MSTKTSTTSNESELFFFQKNSSVKIMQCFYLYKQQRKMEWKIVKNVNKNAMTESDQN